MTSRLKKKYSSRDNKGIIWGVLLENKLFEGLNDSQSILNEFEQQIRTIGETIQQKDSIVSLNKKTINHMVSHIKYMKTQQQQTSQLALPNTSSAHTIEDIMKERQQHFKKTLNAKQEEFKRTIQGHIPKAIDFSDKAEQPMDGDMDRKLSELMEKRGVELNYLPKKEELKKATNWIQNGGTFQPTTTTSNEQSIQLQIGEKVELNELNDFQPIPIYKEQDNTSFRKKQSSLLSTSKQKKVRFSDADTTSNTEVKTTTNDFLQMLKTKHEPIPTPTPTPTQNQQQPSHTDKNLSNQVNEITILLKSVLEKINTMEKNWNELKKEKREIINKREISTQTISDNKKKFKDAETNTNDIEEKIISPSQKNKKGQQTQKN